MKKILHTAPLSKNVFCEDQRDKNFSLVLVLGGGPNKVSTNDFPHVMFMMCCL